MEQHGRMKEITRTQLKLSLGEFLLEAYREPIAITDRGRNAHVILAYDHYMEMVKKLEALEAKLNRPAKVLVTPEQG